MVVIEAGASIAGKAETYGDVYSDLMTWISCQWKNKLDLSWFQGGTSCKPALAPARNWNLVPVGGKGVKATGVRWVHSWPDRSVMCNAPDPVEPKCWTPRKMKLEGFIVIKQNRMSR